MTEEVLRLPSFGQANDPACLPPVVVQDDRFTPALQPGDRLVPVTCRVRRPTLGEYVLIRQGGGAGLMRFIATIRQRGAPGLLVWTGRGYGVHPEGALIARILSVVRHGRSWDLSVARGWPGRDRLMIALHRLLARLTGGSRR